MRIRRTTYNTAAHHKLNDDNEGPQDQRGFLAEAVEEYLSHRLTNWTIHDAIEISAHAKRERHVDGYSYPP